MMNGAITSSNKDDKKNKRPDRSEKLIERKQFDLTVVKAALRKYIHGDEDVVDRIVYAIKIRVANLSRRTVEMSYALLGLVKDLFHGVQDVTTIQLDDLFDQTVIRQLMLGPGDAKSPSDRVIDYYVQHPELTPIVQRDLYDRNIYSAAAITYLTNFKNALRFSIDARIKSFCRRFKDLHQLSNSEYVFMMYGIHGWSSFPGHLVKGGGLCPARREVVEAIKEHRYVLGLFGNTRISKGWIRLDSSLSPMLRYNVFLNRFYEANGRLKIFNIVPVCQIKAHFMTIDTSVLFGILKDAKVIDKKLDFETFDGLRDEQWHSTFKIPKLRGNNNIFGDNVQTEGVSMCMHFQRPKRPPISELYDVKKGYLQSDDDVVFGLDPGRVNIFYLTTLLPSGKPLCFSLTRRQYYHDVGIFNAVKQSNKWNENVKLALNAMSRASPKGSSINSHILFLDTYFCYQESLWGEYLAPRWSRQRLALYGGKKRTFARFFNKVETETRKRNPHAHDIVIAFGSAKFAPGGQNELSVPTTRAYKECAFRFTTIVTPEFRSSKVSSLNDSVLQLIASKAKGPGRNHAFRGILWDVPAKSIVSRDLNAALNIRRMLLHAPNILRRELATSKLTQRIVKRINPRK